MTPTPPISASDVAGGEWQHALRLLLQSEAPKPKIEAKMDGEEVMASQWVNNLFSCMKGNLLAFIIHWLSSV